MPIGLTFTGNLTGNQDRDKIEVKFDYRLDGIVNFGVTCPRALKIKLQQHLGRTGI